MFLQEILSKDKTEKKFKEKVKQLEVSLKEALEQIKFYKNELEIINDYCGKEKNSLNDALAAIRSKYRANVEQFQVQFQVISCSLILNVKGT